MLYVVVNRICRILFKLQIYGERLVLLLLSNRFAQFRSNAFVFNKNIIVELCRIQRIIHMLRNYIYQNNRRSKSCNNAESNERIPPILECFVYAQLFFVLFAKEIQFAIDIIIKRKQK